jgi:hypothetical protein
VIDEFSRPPQPVQATRGSSPDLPTDAVGRARRPGRPARRHGWARMYPRSSRHRALTSPC